MTEEQRDDKPQPDNRSKTPGMPTMAPDEVVEWSIGLLREITKRHPDVLRDCDVESFVNDQLQPTLDDMRAPRSAVAPMTASDFRLMSESEKYGCYASAMRRIAQTPTLRLMTQCSRHQGVPITIRSTLQTAVFYCPQCEEESAATDSRSANADKLYRVTVRGFPGDWRQVAYVVAQHAGEAYGKVRDKLNSENVGFASDRELGNVELIADISAYPTCGCRLFL